MESDLYLNNKRQEEEKESAEEVLVKNNTQRDWSKSRNKWTPKTTIIEGEFHKEENWHTCILQRYRGGMLDYYDY